MSEVLFILGAGASKKAGAPLMNEFLDVAEDLEKQGIAGNAASDFELVFRGISELQAAHSKSQIDLQNIESVFEAFEMAKLLGRLGTLSHDEIDRLPHAIRQLITKTLDMTIELTASNQSIPPPEPYADFVNLLHSIISANPRTGVGQVSVITFNYDICLDYALHYNNVPVDYCLGNRKGHEGLKLLKLHGSVNWIRCPGCQNVVPWHMRDFFRNRSCRLFPDEVKKVRIDIGSIAVDFRHCGTNPAKEPMIVPPTSNKAQWHEELEVVWRAAAAEFENAENIFISGYSLSPTDQFFRYLYALGTIGPARVRRFWVFDPDKNVEERFRELLGPGAYRGFMFEPKTFEEAIAHIWSELNLPSVQI